jgi:hypothetical protein
MEEFENLKMGEFEMVRWRENELIHKFPNPTSNIPHPTSNIQHPTFTETS